MKKIIITVIIVVAVAWLFYYYKTASHIPPKDLHEINMEASLSNGQKAIFVSDQMPGESVTIAVAVIETGGFIVIHQMGPDRGLGKIIGNSQYVDAPGGEQILIKLDRQVVDGEKLFAVIYGDDGDKKFDIKSDKPMFADGEPIMAKFMIDSGYPQAAY